MKASLKIRDEQKPLLRAKIPVSVVGLPFLSGVSAGEAKELRLDLATAFESGPSLRLSYRPNDPWNPFGIVVKTGIGAFGSPASSPLTMSAEFNLVGGRGGPSFAIQIKPRLGNFCVSKSTCSAAGSFPPFGLACRPIVADHGADGDGPVNGVVFPRENGMFTEKKPNGMSTGIPAVTSGGIQSLLSGAELMARTVLPLWNGAAVKIRWGLRVPSELQTSFMDDLGRKDPVAGISLSRLPFLVMSKVSIEHIHGEATPKEKPTDIAEACLSVQRQLAVLHAENGTLRRAVEDLRSDLGARGPGLLASGVDAAGKVPLPGARGHNAWVTDGNKARAAPPVKNGGRSCGQKGEGKVEAGGAAAKEDLNQELRKALVGATGAEV